MATSMNSARTVIGLDDISMFDGSNFDAWRENLMLVLTFMDMDIALREDFPTVNEKIIFTEKELKERWDQTNHFCLMAMERFIPEKFRDAVLDQVKTAKEFLEIIGRRFVRIDKSETGTLLANLVSMKYKGRGNIKEYIMEMSNVASKLRTLKLEISEELLVHLLLISLPSHFQQFKVSYYQKETWSLNEFISQCVEEEKKMASQKRNRRKANKKRKRSQLQEENKEAVESTQEKPENDKKSREDTGCFFSGAEGHTKKQCRSNNTCLVKKAITEVKTKCTGGTGSELQGNESSKPLKKKVRKPSKKFKRKKQHQPCGICENTEHLSHNCPLAPSSDWTYSSIEIVSARVYTPEDFQTKGTIDHSKLYVAYLPQSLNTNRLIELFKPFGKISEAYVVMDANTGLSKGYGFVRYTDRKSATNAMAAMNGTMIEGKRIVVRVASVSYGNAPANSLPCSNKTGPSGAPMLNQPPFPVSLINKSIQPGSNSASKTALFSVTGSTLPAYTMAGFSPAFCPASQTAAIPVVKKSGVIPANTPGNLPVVIHPNSNSSGPSKTMINRPLYPVSTGNHSIQQRSDSAFDTGSFAVTGRKTLPAYPMTGFSTAFCPAIQNAVKPVVENTGIIPTAEDFSRFPGYLKSFDDPKTAVS